MAATEIRVLPVRNRKNLKDFLTLPFGLYKDDKNWAPPIRILEAIEYKRKTNPVLMRSEYELFIAKRVTQSGEIVAGRIIAYIDPRYIAHHKVRIGFFGAFEADGPDVSHALHKAADSWLAGRNVYRVRGPIDPVAECWGFVVDGYAVPPVYMSPHNPPQYGAWAEQSGYLKAKDLLVFEADASTGYTLPERYKRFRDNMAARRPEIQVRRINRKKISEEARTILSIYNRGIDGNWGFTPVGEDEMADVVDKLALIIDPDAVWFVEDRGRPVGCALGFPDINVLIRQMKGNLFPLGWWQFLRKRRDIRNYRLWGLAVLPEYKGLGLDVLMYVNLFDCLQPRGIRLEANYVLEDNAHIVNSLKKLGMTAVKRYRVYEKPIKSELSSRSPE